MVLKRAECMDLYQVNNYMGVSLLAISLATFMKLSFVAF